MSQATFKMGRVAYFERLRLNMGFAPPNPESSRTLHWAQPCVILPAAVAHTAIAHNRESLPHSVCSMTISDACSLE